ncbi:TonB-dependent receptor plug domain-containing protein [Spongiimicrobium salis]|uniref:TonB-dependent receptor plug domain-containing protein n=1 Tax=Spongiimicrobium salis TaxID=1667022 RepID=UPI00374D700E
MKTIQTFLRSALLWIVVLLCAAFTLSDKTAIGLEKIYTHTDRPFYFPGETIWFKSYIVDSENKATTTSDVIFAELISPKGIVVKSLKLDVQQGYAYGDFFIANDWVGGMYTLKMYSQWMKNYGTSSFFTKKIPVQKVVKPKLLLQLSFEKESYGQNSKVQANFEVKDLKNNPLPNKEITFSVLLKGKSFLLKKIKTGSEGKAKPIFNLPDTLNTADVVLNILVPYNETTVSISRSVPITLDTIDLQFFPESGKLLEKTKNHVAFKALNEFAKPVDVAGIITDENGLRITDFTSYHNGMGGFYLSPEASKTYYALITSPFLSKKKIKLPKVHSKGVNFILESTPKNATFHIYNTTNTALFLEVSNASQLLHRQEVASDQTPLSIPTTAFPAGITKFSLMDSQREILAERLVFLNASKKLVVRINSDKEIYETREKVMIHIKTTDEKNSPVPANLSLSVADNALLSFADDKQDHISSYLLLSSELKGKIYKPKFYFDEEEPKSKKALDYVMLTHGWRNYIQNDVLPLKEAVYKPEQKGLQTIQVHDTDGNPIQANILLFDRYGNKVLVDETHKNGSYTFKIAEGIHHILLAYREDKKQLRIVKGNTTTGTKSAKNKTSHPKDFSDVKGFKAVVKPLQKPIQQQVIAPIRLEEDSESLDEVVVVGYGSMAKRNLSASAAFIHSENLQQYQSIASALQGQVAGVQINTTGSATSKDTSIIIRGAAAISGNSQPLYILDGVPINSRDVSVLHPSRISSITVLKDIAATTLYGTAASNGVILINSKNGAKDYGRKKKLHSSKYNNYATAQFYSYPYYSNHRKKQFYVPQYTGKALPHERSDFRQTIYWNPVVQTDEAGTATLEFYNSDAITSFKVTAEGIGYNGLVGRAEKDYSTKKVLHIDVKTPNYMAVNDTVVLPMVISNNASNSFNVQLSFELPNSIKPLEDLPKTIYIEANSTITKPIKIIPLKVDTKGTLGITAKSSYYNDVVQKDISIISPYFPTEASLSGNKSQAFQFNVAQVVPKSLTAEFNIYTDVIGDVLDGIEGMIRKPYGCFEQTSSSTYPNIMVLKYLKESGKSNPKIERRALKFIKEGYQKLIGFETKEGGFEWFGDTPPHETLTAYGVLEFTEMKEVYKGVSEKMLKRTVAWLMSRRDGKGGFMKSNKGYDSFASSPKDVANAYIVYALSEAGIQVDIQKEYEYAYNEALKSKDAYRLALMTLASYNFNKKEKAQLLLREIKKHIAQNGFSELPVSHTITRSYGNGKIIETSAFTVLALLREEQKHKTYITQGIESILKNRKHGRFGATQSTAMALKALIAYTKNFKRDILSAEDNIALTINGHTLRRALEYTPNGIIKIRDIAKYITSGTQEVQVEFSSNKLQFPYSLVLQWDSYLPDSSEACKVLMDTHIPVNNYRVGDIIPMKVDIKNMEAKGIPMVTAIIGIPSGASLQPWQLEEFLEQHKVAYYELSENYIICYWREFRPKETKTLRFSLKAEIAGSYTAPASSAYLYYSDEDKQWIPGESVVIEH